MTDSLESMLSEARDRVGEFEKICFRSIGGKLGRTERRLEATWEESRIAAVVERCLQKYRSHQSDNDRKLNIVLEKLSQFEEKLEVLERKAAQPMSPTYSLPVQDSAAVTPLLHALNSGNAYEMPSRNPPPSFNEGQLLSLNSALSATVGGKSASFAGNSGPCSEMLTEDHSNLPSAAPSAVASPLTLSLPLPLHALNRRRDFSDPSSELDTGRTAPIDTIGTVGTTTLHSGHGGGHRRVPSASSVASQGGLLGSYQRMQSDEVVNKSSIKKKGAPPNTERRASIDIPQAMSSESVFDSEETDTSETPSFDNQQRIDSQFGALERTRIVRFGSPSENQGSNPTLTQHHSTLLSPTHSSSSERSRDTSVFDDDPTAI
eukprot:TRINITY_DN34544_c0_g1_i1.p1 TRINITY_DN34544_c0_g1~~TRINITY_DN34544_c0_g1_i1.p1  ORF type:complete len:387 (+),score=77.83 TRINITY_DN34544_c0_g1_i1:36-1163(+)